MDVSELIEYLQAFDGDRKVMIAQQPSWPLASSLRGVVDASEVVEDDDDPEDPDPYKSNDPRDDATLVWLVAGDASEYAPRAVFEGGW